MEILAFFSFKGGVGRTALLTNLAAYWASLGRVVGLIDMDLAAPGLSFSSELSTIPLDPELGEAGFSDLLAAYYAGRDEGDRLGYFPPAGLFREMRAPHGQWGNQGLVLVMPAGRVQFRYPPVTEVGELFFPARQGRQSESGADRALRAFAALLRRDMTDFRLPQGHPQAGRGLDYLLIDCRTGFPELLDMVMGYLADRMVLVSGLNGQNLTGLDITLASLRQERVPEGRFARDVTVVFSPVPVHSYDDPEAMAALKEGQNIIDRHRKPAKEHLQQEAGPMVFTLPYTPRLAVSDRPLTTDNPNHPYSRSVVEIAEFLQGKPVDNQIVQVNEQFIRAGSVTRKRTESLDQESLDLKNRVPLEAEDCRFIMQLPRWYWPFSPHSEPDQEVARKFAQFQSAQPDLSPDRLGQLLDGICGSISLGKAKKQEMLASFDQLSRPQIDQLSETFQTERQQFSAMSEKYQDNLHEILYKHQMEWADLMIDPPGEGVRRFLLWPLQGISWFPTWERLPGYWCSLARDLKGILGQKQSAWQAVERALALNAPPERTLTALLELLDPSDSRWNGQILQQAKSLAGDNLWLQFQVLRKEPAPDKHRVDAILEPLLQQEPPEDGFLCTNFSVWILNNYPRLAARTEPFLRRALHQLPDHSYVWNSWGNLLSGHLGRFEEAEAAYRKAISLDDQYASPWNGLGNLLSDHLGRFEEAEAAYRKAISLDDQFAYPWNGLGVLLANHLGRFEEAEAAYRKAISLDDQFATPWNGLGNLLADHLGRFEEAEAAYRKAISLDDQDATLWNNLGWMYLDVMGHCQEALEMFDQGLRRDSSSSYLHMNRGWLLLITGQEQEGREALSSARSGFADGQGVYDLLFRIRMELALGIEPVSLNDQERNLLQVLQTNCPEHFDWLCIQALLTLAQDGVWSADRLLANLWNFVQYNLVLEILYSIGGLRPDLRATVRSGVATLLAAYPDKQPHLKGVPLSSSMLARFQPFATGQSDGLGDPRDLHLFCIPPSSR